MIRESNSYLNDYRDPSSYLDLRSIPPACRKCHNHISNGGSGICYCILGDMSQVADNDYPTNTVITTATPFEGSYQLTTTDRTYGTELRITSTTGETVTIKTNATDIFKMML